MRINTVYCGDCIQGLSKLPDKCVDAIITDPPFGIGFNYKEKEQHTNPDEYWSWLKPIYQECLRVLKDGGFIAIWQTQLYFKFFWSWFGEDIQIYAGCKNFVQLRKTAINRAYDPIIIKYKPADELLRPKKPQRNVDFFVANTAKFVTETKNPARKHPCPRPIDQTEELVKNFTIPNGLILDPFMGSGTTALACLRNNRTFIGFEKDPEYCKIIKKRVCVTGFFGTQVLPSAKSLNSDLTGNSDEFPQILPLAELR